MKRVNEMVSASKKMLYPTINDLVSSDKSLEKESLYNNLGAVSLAQTMNESQMALKMK